MLRVPTGKADKRGQRNEMYKGFGKLGRRANKTTSAGD
jgi:hypothetical protein